MFPAFLESVYVLHLQILPDSACKRFDSFKGLQRYSKYTGNRSVNGTIT